MSTADVIRARIDALECLADVHSAIEEASDVEWDDFEQQSLDVHVSRRTDSSGVAFVLGLPQSVLIAGLRAMERELSAMCEVALPPPMGVQPQEWCDREGGCFCKFRNVVCSNYAPESA